MTIRREKVAFFLVTKRTTAGERGTFAYDKLVEIAIWSVIRPWESMVLGGSWRRWSASTIKNLVNARQSGVY